MGLCKLCKGQIKINDMCYYTTDLGPDLLNVLERRLNGQQVLGSDDVLCEQCFLNITYEMDNGIKEEINEEVTHPEEVLDENLPLPSDLIKCIWCRASLHKKRSRNLPPGPVRALLEEMISPREIPPGGMVCYACWQYVERRVPANLKAEPQEDIGKEDNTFNLSKCVCCSTSLLFGKRWRVIPEGPERNEIADRLAPRQIPTGGRVCYACWISARRSVQRRRDGIEENVPAHRRHISQNCGWCLTSLHRRKTHTLLEGPERDEVLKRIHPRELPRNALLCGQCWQRAHAITVVLDPYEILEQPLQQTMTMDSFRITTRTNNRCFVTSCTNPERLTVRDDLRKLVLKSKKLYITRQSRVCKYHSSLQDWDFLDIEDYGVTFTKDDFEEIMKLSLG